MRLRKTLLTAAVLAAAAWPARAQDGFDEGLKIWFPPDAPKEAYLSRDPAHSFGNDVRKAFTADPSLRESVCGRLASRDFVPEPGSLEPGVMQLRAMEDMMCVSLAMQAKQLADQTRRSEGASDLLAGWFAQEREAAEKLAPAERRGEEYELRNRAFRLPSGNERARAGVRMIALRPQDEMGIQFLLEHGTEANYGTPGPGDIEKQVALPGEKPSYHVSAQHVRDFLADLYGSMIENGGDDAGPFRSGWAGYLFLTGGDLREARRLASEFLSDPAEDNVPYQRIFIAFLDRRLGNPAPLADLLAKCPFQPQDEVAAAISANYCRTVAWSLANRLIEVHERPAPADLAEIFLEAIRAEPTNWTLRLESIRSLDRLDPERAAREYRAILDLPATAIPEGARLDALDGATTALADRRDFRGALAVNQRWLDTAGYKPARLAADGWGRLAGVPKAAALSEPCDDTLACVLKKRIHLALSAGDFDLARRTLEERLSYAFDREFAEETRARLDEIAQAELDRGDRASALRIVRYLWNQAKDPQFTQFLKQQRESLSPKGGPLVPMTPEDRPW